MNSKLLKIFYALEANPILASIRKGFVLVIPVVITGTLALLLRSLPIAPLTAFLSNFANGILLALLTCIYDITQGMISIYLVLAISYYYSQHLAPHTPLRVTSMATALLCFTASFGGVGGSLTLESFGATGIFTAILSAIISVRLFFFFFHHTSRSNRMMAEGADGEYHTAMAAIMPLVLCVLTFACANILLGLFGAQDFNQLISDALLFSFRDMDGNLAGSLLYTLLLHLLWAFGIHGGNALSPTAISIFAPTGETLLSKAFLDNFVTIGGCGTTICLLLALLLSSRFRSNRRLARSALPMVLFNINELLIFGLPIVLNPILFFPFVLVPIMALLVSYFAVAIGFMPMMLTEIHWTTPVLFSGYMSTSSWQGLVVQLFIIVVGTAIYIPFIRLYERMQIGRQVELVNELVADFKKHEGGEEQISYLHGSGRLSLIAKRLVEQLQGDMVHRAIPLFYQPQVNPSGRVVGAEALLRWRFAGHFVYPPLLIALAREADCLDTLTLQIFECVCDDIDRFDLPSEQRPQVSVNLVAPQLDNRAFVQKLVQIALDRKVCNCLSFEITEETSLTQFVHISENIEFLRQNGIGMAIDDFSMGQTSLNYLRTNSFGYVKLDGSLTKQLADNDRCREIVASIVQLGQSLHFEVIAEYVETEALRDVLLSLGCRCYQGYLYSPAVPLPEFLQYLQAHSPYHSGETEYT